MRVYSTELCHHGIRKQKWGFRRFQNKDGTLTEAGKARYRKNREEYGYKMADKMSDEELKKATARLNAEKAYNDAFAKVYGAEKKEEKKGGGGGGGKNQSVLNHLGHKIVDSIFSDFSITSMNADEFIEKAKLGAELAKEIMKDFKAAQNNQSNNDSGKNKQNNQSDDESGKKKK